MSDLTGDVEQLRRGGAAPLARDVVRVVGPDAERFLQGQLSADLGALAPEEGAWSLLCDPSGRMGHWLRVSRFAGEEFTLDVDSGHGDAVVARLRRFLLRTDSTVTLDEPDAWVAIAVRGPVQVELDHAAGSTVLTLPSPWPGVIGWDILAPSTAHVRIDTPTVGADALEVLRVECGVPAHGAEITDGVIPAELGQWLIDASVSFTKGCYTGQELVARIDSRGGNVPRRLRGVVVDGAPPEVGDELVVDDRAVGTVTSAVVSPQVGPLGLALVARAVEPQSSVVVRGAHGDRRGTVVELPVVDDLDRGGPSQVAVSIEP